MDRDYWDCIVLITRYFSWRLLKSHLEITMIMGAGLLIMRLLSELKRVRLAYTTADAVYYVMGMLPTSLARYDSVIVCLATCLWFMHVRRTQELLVVQVAGVSLQKLLYKMLPACLCIIGLFTLNREWIAPRMAAHAKEVRSQRVSGGHVYFQDNQMWLRTPDGFLMAVIGQDSHLLQQVRYYVFKDQKLTSWWIAPKAVYYAGHWTAPRADHFVFHDQGQAKTLKRQVRLPVPLKPRVLAWSFLRPEYLSARQIAESLAKGKKLGISERISWLLLSARIMRPVNVCLLMVLTLTVLNKAISSRFVGLSVRMMVVVFVAVLEFLLYEFMCASQNALDFQSSAMIAMTPAVCLLLLIGCISVFRQLQTMRRARLAQVVR